MPTRYGDFIPAERPEIATEPQPGVFHVKVTCKWCGILLGHFRVEGRGHFIPVEVEPCPECLTGMSINQQLTVTEVSDDEKQERNTG